MSLPLLFHRPDPNVLVVSTVSSRNNKRKRTTASGARIHCCLYTSCSLSHPASPPALPRGAHSTPSDTDSNHDLFGPSAFDRYDMDDFNDDEDDTTEARAMVNLGRNKITTSDGPSLPSTPYEPVHNPWLSPSYYDLNPSASFTTGVHPTSPTCVAPPPTRLLRCPSAFAPLPLTMKLMMRRTLPRKN